MKRRISILTAAAAASLLFAAPALGAEGGGAGNGSDFAAAAGTKGSAASGFAVLRSASGSGLPSVSDPFSLPPQITAGEKDVAGLALWEAAQERQRGRSFAEAEMEGAWSVEISGLSLRVPFSGAARFEGLGTDGLRGQLTVESGFGGGQREYRFQDGAILVKDGDVETATSVSPEKWRYFSENLMNYTTYDLSFVETLWVSGREAEREDCSTVLSYELNGQGAAGRIEPVAKQALSEAGITVAEETGWLKLDQVRGELTISSAGYMAVDRLWAKGAIRTGNQEVPVGFEISIVYGEP